MTLSGELQRSGSGGEVNGLSEMLIERVPAIDFSERDLTGGEQRPEQHGGGLGRRQHGLRLDAPLELLVQPLDGVGGARALPLLGWQPREGEEPIARFLEARCNGLDISPAICG